MKNNGGEEGDPASSSSELGALFDGWLASPDALRLAEEEPVTGPLRHGFHSHDGWEVFCPIRGSLCFEVAGGSPTDLPAGTLLIVPPGTLHMNVVDLPQSRKLNLLSIGILDKQIGYAVAKGTPIVFHERACVVRTAAAWTELLGESPSAIMERVTRALAKGFWGRQRALGHLRVLFAMLAQVSSRSSPGADGEQYVAQVMQLLQNRYFEPGLLLAAIVKEVGLSPTYLSSLFRQTTGSTIHQMLVDIRCRRAMALLKQGNHTIKEIAGLTGWSNQLYFSAAFRKRFGKPPSVFRP